MEKYDLWYPVIYVKELEHIDPQKIIGWMLCKQYEGANENRV